MRNSFAKAITSIADADARIRLLVGDIGFGVFDEFRQKHPDKFINCGIAEQNMISVGAGMASEGLKVFIYTITPFLLARAFEQIRVDIGINKSHCILVGVGAGLAYDKLGPTHHAAEDIALMRCISGMKTYLPYDPVSVCEITNMAYERLAQNPSYLRISKGGEPALPPPVESNEWLSYWKTSKRASALLVSHGALAGELLLSIEAASRNIDVIGIKQICPEAVRSLDSIIERDERIASTIIFLEECHRFGSAYDMFMSLSKHRDMVSAGRFLPDDYLYENLPRKKHLHKLGLDLDSVSS